MLGAFTVESFEVTSGSLPEASPAADIGAAARVMTCMPLPGRTPDALAAICSRVEQTSGAATRSTGVLTMTHTGGQRIIVFELWPSQPALATTDGDARALDARIWRSGVLHNPPEREAVEVFGRY